MNRRQFTVAILSMLLLLPLKAAEPETPAAPKIDTTRGDRMIAAYFRSETQKLTDHCLTDVETLEDWESKKSEYRQQLFEMLGLDPLPERTPLNPVVTGRAEHEQFTVENLHFQSRPGLYVTGNLYVPKKRDEKLPAILYVCGHGRVKKDGISYGNKAQYQHHGSWFARNGYVCLTIDTLQLGEIEGIHHGTYNHNMWWWNARGYSSAAVEAWNCIRALDYLQSRDEVDPERMGVTGRSGGGAYSWWIAALDERIQAAVPVAGITSLANHVVDGCVEGHCDCMYMVNTYRWDFPLVAALVAPRPLLISNTDKDGIFPLDGVVDVYVKTKKIYDLYGKPRQLGLQITEGPHQDTQELRVHAFRWFNRFLKKDEEQVDSVTEKFFEPEQLKVFAALPEDEKNTTIQETFTLSAPVPKVPESSAEWEKQRDEWLAALRAKSFRGWPEETAAAAESLQLEKAFKRTYNGVTFSAWDFTSQEEIRLRLYLAHREGLKPSELDLIVLNVLDAEDWNEFLAMMQVGFAEQLKEETLPAPNKDDYDSHRKMFQSFKWGMAYVAPRGIGPTAWDQSDRKQTQHRRRFMLLGQTRDGMQAWDVRRAIQALRATPGTTDVPLWLQAERQMAGIALYASLFEPNVTRLDLHHLPAGHRDGPIFLNVLRYLDLPQAVAMAAERSQVRIYQQGEAGWEFPQSVAAQIGWDKKQLQVRDLSKLPKPAAEGK